MADFLTELKRRVLVYDGAMGTNLQKHNLTAEDFWGHEGCNELLVLSRPEVIRAVHASFLEAGCDVIETDSFGSNSIVLVEYGLAERTRELNLAAARLARAVADEYSTPEKPRFVSAMTPDEHKIPDVFNFVQILLDLSKNRHYIKKLPIRNIRPFHFLLFYNQPLHILLFYNHPSQFVHRFLRSHHLA